MSTEVEEGLRILSSVDFFAALRSALARVGLAGEEKFGVIVYFVMTSRFCPNPLRIAFEDTEGGAEYVVRCVSKLFEPATVCGVDTEVRWSRLKANATHKVAYVRQWAGGQPEGFRFEVRGNSIVRLKETVHNGRTVGIPDPVEGKFACIAEQYPWQFFDEPRWLRVDLAEPPIADRTEPLKLDDQELGVWRVLQELLRERAKRIVVFPDWTAAIVEAACRDERRSRRLPYLLRAWQTMAIIRSFVKEDTEAESEQQNMIVPNFDDLAMTSLLLRGVSKEAHWLPSSSSIFNEVFPVGGKTGVVNPLTGKGVQYNRRPDVPAAMYQSLIDA